MTQGEPLSPTIYNVVVYAVVRHCELLVAERAGVDIIKDDAAQPEGRTIRASDNGRRRTEEGDTWLKLKAVLFYSDNRMVASTNSGCIQTAFDMLTGIFDRVVMNKMPRKLWVWYAAHAGKPG